MRLTPFSNDTPARLCATQRNSASKASHRPQISQADASTIAFMRLAALYVFPFIASAQLVAPNSVPIGSIPVVFLNGYQFGCTGGSGFSSNFGSADTVLQASKLTTLFFDNCSVMPSGSTIETLATAFGKFLGSLSYADGTPVPQVDVVAHSMGGLIVRAYLSGKQDVPAGTPATFSPPAAPGIRKAIFLATPHFGTAVASLLGSDTQTKEMSLGSQFLFDLNTWNQGTDDLRGVDALAIAGNGGTGFESSLPGFDDGVVELTSASIGFARPARTRIVPDCHTADSLVLTFGVCPATAPAINNISDANNVVGKIITSFLTGTSAWTLLGQAVEANATFGTTTGGLLLGAEDSTGLQQSITTATAGATALKTNALAYNEALPANISLPLQLNLTGSTSRTSTVKLTAGTSTPFIAKPGPSITGVVPAGIAQFPLNVAPGAFVTVYGSSLASAVTQASQPYPAQLADVQVLVNGTAAPVEYASPTQINFIYPNLPPGLATLTVSNSTGQQTVNVLLAPAVPSIFTSNGLASGPAAAENASTGAIISSSTPLHAGDYVALYLTGLGQTPSTTTVAVGGQNCAGQSFFAGHVPSYMGLDQVNCQIPGGVTGSTVSVVVTTNGRSSNTATLNIQ
jgi:uncharacterized protein (TIGR03437 family)